MTTLLGYLGMDDAELSEAIDVAQRAFDMTQADVNTATSELFDRSETLAQLRAIVALRQAAARTGEEGERTAATVAHYLSVKPTIRLRSGSSHSAATVIAAVQGALERESLRVRREEFTAKALALPYGDFPAALTLAAEYVEIIER